MRKKTKKSLAFCLATVISVLTFSAALTTSANEEQIAHNFNIFTDAGEISETFVSSMSDISRRNLTGSYFSKMVMTPGESEMSVDGKKIELSVPAEMDESGNAILPVGDLAEKIGAAVEIDQNSGEMSIIHDGREIEIESFQSRADKETAQASKTALADFQQEIGETLENESSLMISEEDAEQNLNLSTKTDNGKIIITNPYQSKQIILYVKNGGDLTEKYGASEFTTNGQGLYFLQYATEQQTKTAYEAFKSNSAIEYVTLNEITVSAVSDTDDSTSLGSWGTDGDDSSMGIQASRMKNILSSTQQEIIVGVVDSGVDGKYLTQRNGHEFLQGRVTEPSSATDDTAGYNYINNTNNPYDDKGHGTHVSGTIVDCTPSNVKILPVKSLNSDGKSQYVTVSTGTASSVSLGIQYAAENGAQVINLSLGGSCSQDNCLHEQIVESITENALENNQRPPIFVVSAGNDDVDVMNTCPARLSTQFDNVITVGAIDKDDLSYYFSNYGQAVDVCAPGVSIRSCIPNNGYANYSGTSMAAPHVSAAVAMLLLRYPNYSSGQIKNLLKGMTVDLGEPGWDGAFGNGRIDFRMLDDTEYPKASSVAASSLSLKKINISGVQDFSSATIATDHGEVIVGTVVSPKDCTDKSITYSVSDTSVIDFENSRAFAIGYGSSVVTASKNTLPQKQGTISVTYDCWNYYAAENFAGGSGTSTNPYLISTPQQLAKISYESKMNGNHFNNKYFELTNDIDLGGKYWTPIYHFAGKFDGKNHIIKNMSVREARKTEFLDAYTFTSGFFADTVLADISNLGVEDAVNTAPIYGASENYKGLLIGRANDSNITNCYTTGSVATGGGLIGRCTNKSEVKNCYSSASQTKGGLIYEIKGAKVENCYSTGTQMSGGAGFAYKVSDYGTEGQSSYFETNICNSFSNIDADSGVGFIDTKQSGVITNCYYLNSNTYGVKTDSNSDETDLTAKSDSFFKTKSSFTTSANWNSNSPWNFESIWDIDSFANEGAPFLRSFVTKVFGITLNKSIMSLYRNETQTLTATVHPSYAVNQTLQWSSSDTSIATVDQTGTVTGKATSGTATITATATDGSGVFAECTFNADDFSGNPSNATYLSLHSARNGRIDAPGDVDCYRFTAKYDGIFVFYTTGTTDTKGYLLDSNRNQIASNDDAGISGQNFAIKYNCENGKTYYVKVGAYGNKTGNYSLNMVRGVYSTSLSGLNQDARCVQMQATAASILTTLKLTVGNTVYTLTKPSSGNLDVTVNGARFKVTYETANNGFATVWNIKAKLPSSQSEQTVKFTFSKGSITNVDSSSITGFVPYASSIKTGIDPTTNLYVFKNTTMAQSGYTITIRSWDNQLVDATTSAKVAIGMKVVKTNNTTGKIEEIFYVVLFGDVTGNGQAGDGLITTDDSLPVLQESVGNAAITLQIARLAADVDHNGEIENNDALMIQQAALGKITINQNYTISDVPDECYYLEPVSF